MVTTLLLISLAGIHSSSATLLDVEVEPGTSPKPHSLQALSSIAAWAEVKALPEERVAEIDARLLRLANPFPGLMKAGMIVGYSLTLAAVAGIPLMLFGQGLQLLLGSMLLATGIVGLAVGAVCTVVGLISSRTRVEERERLEKEREDLLHGPGETARLAPSLLLARFP